MWSAAVPVDVATEKRVPTRAASSLSNRSTNAPTEETHPVSRHSLTYFHSFPRISGIERGMWPSAAGVPGSLQDVDARTILIQMLLNPVNGEVEPRLERDGWLPAQNSMRRGAIGKEPIDLAPLRPNPFLIALDQDGTVKEPRNRFGKIPDTDLASRTEVDRTTDRLWRTSRKYESFDRVGDVV